jgi:hypothetical protein
MKLLIMHLSPAYYCFIAWSPNIVRTLFRNSLDLCSPLSIGLRDEVSHPGKIIVLRF